MIRSAASLLAAALGMQIVAGLSAGGVEPDRSPGPRPWEPVHRWLQSRRDRLAADLERAHAMLRKRAADDAELLARLSPEPPRPLPRGYRVLPTIADDDPSTPVSPAESLYSLEKLSAAFTLDFRDAAILAGRAAETDLSPGSAVTEFERLRKRMRNLEEHLAYHAYWQEAVVEHPDFFAERNRIITKVREMQLLRERNAPPERIAEIRTEIMARLAPFRATPDLILEIRADGTRVLPVTLCTDIEDDTFLSALREGVEAAFVHSDPARALRFAVELRWRRLTPGDLYRGHPPERGATIDLEAHRARFPEDCRVVTTGAESTHAWSGRSVLIGPSPVSRRTLAHEFGHLLGFSDAYLRGYDGDPGGRFGAVLVEWTGLSDDLMGNPAGGRVTPAMIETLIDAYAPR